MRKRLFAKKRKEIQPSNLYDSSNEQRGEFAQKTRIKSLKWFLSNKHSAPERNRENKYLACVKDVNDVYRVYRVYCVWAIVI